MQRICILIYAPKNLRISKIKRRTTTATRPSTRKQAKVDERKPPTKKKKQENYNKIKENSLKWELAGAQSFVCSSVCECVCVY